MTTDPIIVKFFDKISKDRNEILELDKILAYEQEMRQRAIFNMLRLTPGNKILDAGCGTGRDAMFYIKNGLAYVGMDLSKEMLQKAYETISTEITQSNRKPIIKLREDVYIDDISNKVIFLYGGITNIPVKDNSFDFVVCSEVIEHVPNWTESLKEFKRVLRDGGILLITTPNIYSLYGLTRLFYENTIGWSHPFDQWKNYWALKKELSKIGFEIEEVRGACYLPGLLSYNQRVKRFLIPLLLSMKHIEERISKNFFFKYFGYMIAVKCKNASSCINQSRLL